MTGVKHTKRTKEVDSLQFNGDNLEELKRFVGDKSFVTTKKYTIPELHFVAYVHSTLDKETVDTMKEGDWVFKDKGMLFFKTKKYIEENPLPLVVEMDKCDIIQSNLKEAIRVLTEARKNRGINAWDNDYEWTKVDRCINSLGGAINTLEEYRGYIN